MPAGLGCEALLIPCRTVMTISLRPAPAGCYIFSVAPEIRGCAGSGRRSRLAAAATHAGAAFPQPLDGHLAVDHAGAVSHDLEPHAGDAVPRLVRRAVGQSDAVIGDGEPDVAFLDDELHGDEARVTVADGIGHRFLRDAVEVIRSRLVERELRPYATAQPHVDAVHFARPRREGPQGEHEAAEVEAHRREA